MPRVQVGSQTDVGRYRVLNEDALLVGDRIWAVADGMGGHAAGDVASKLVIDTLRRLDEGPTPTAERVVEVIGEAHRAVDQHGEDHPDARGLGTTLTGLVEVLSGDEPHWLVFNVGDSRVYLWAQDGLTRLTVDHSEVEELLIQGLISAEQARVHPARHIITRSVGMRPAPPVDVRTLPQRGGDRFLLCSDGLTSELDDEAISGLLAAHPDPSRAAGALVDAVLATAARDNVTVVVVDVAGGAGEPDESTVPRHLLVEGNR